MSQTLRRGLHAITCSAMLMTIASTAFANDSIHTGDGLLSIQAAMPEQARLGEQFLQVFCD